MHIFVLRESSGQEKVFCSYKEKITFAKYYIHLYKA